MDIIELALSNYTDFFKFEQLCLEVMGYYGFPRIRKVGGIKDDGVDAISSEIYQDETKISRVFQFTMQKDSNAKIKATVKKLNDNNVVFDELVFVTSQSVNSIKGLESKFRMEHSKTLQIFDLSTFILVTGEHKDIISRYFPNIKAQIEEDFLKNNYFSTDGESLLTSSMIKSTLLFSLSPKLKEKIQKKSLFDKSILSLISTYSGGLSRSEIIDEFHKEFGCIIDESQIRASIERLKREGLISNEEEKISASTKAKSEMMEGISHMEQRTNALINDIITKTQELADGIPLSDSEIKQIWNNIQKTLNLFFKYYGQDLAINEDNIVSGMVRQKELIKILTDSIQPDLGECLVYGLGEILSKPNDEQFQTILLWARAYIGTQLMRLDPMLAGFQKKTFASKMYILDTDFVLNCMVKYGPFSDIYTVLLKELLNNGCKVYIPKSVVEEVVIHASFAKRNFNYFRNTFTAVNETVVYEKLSNVFVIDYYINILRNDNEYSDDTFSSYIQNIYDETDEYNFMLEVMEHRLPKGVVIGDESLIDSVSISEVDCDNLTQLIYDETIKTPKAAYRTPEENWRIAKTDAELYLLARELNKNIPQRNNQMLFGIAYLVTSSSRAIRCAKEVNLYSSVVARPKVLVALLSEIGLFDSSNKAIVNLLGNPFLAEAVNQSWEEIKSLIESGVDLRGKELPRLKRELKKEIHELMTKNEELIYSNDSDESDKNDSKTALTLNYNLDDFVSFAKEIQSKGYKMIPAAEKMISTYEEMKLRNEEKEKKYTQIEEELKKVGKGKQRYIRRITGGTDGGQEK